MKWSGNDVIQVNGSDLQSTAGPAAAMYRDRLHMIYKGRSSNDLRVAIYDPGVRRWVSDRKIKDMAGGDGVDPQSDETPAVVQWHADLTIAWKKAKKDAIHTAMWNGSLWTGGQAIAIPSPGRTPATDHAPYLALYGDELVMVHKEKGSKDIHWERYHVATGWTGGQKIAVTDNPDAQYPGTSSRPALVAYRGTLYLLYKGGEYDHLLQSTFDGTDWKGNRVIENPDWDRRLTGAVGPGADVFHDFIYMLDRDGAGTVIWEATFNGLHWTGALLLRDISSINPQTTVSPWVVRVGPDLFLLYKGETTGKLYQAVLKES
jgi:hypothetical protein